ncbi:MAG: glycosyltransferase family 2 protein [Deltaproteobacteria bacterium]|nr:glycosyltransferase family 2 protein [Deltaproteobacteria bacterium]
MKGNSAHQTLSLCMIVKDEEEYIGRCIESVQELVDEMVIVDTGSSDNTIKIASGLGASVYHAPWENDFSRSRNISLDKSRADWILVLDADEVISGRDHGLIRDLISKREYFGFKLDQRSYGMDPNFINWIKTRGVYPEEAGYPGYVSSPLIRLFRNDPRIRFE